MLHSLATLIAVALVPVQPEASGVTARIERNAGSVAVLVTLPPGAKASQPAVLEAPWRLYLDISGARPESEPGLNVEGTTIARVRMALNRVEPPMTRVVIELAARPSWRIERGGAGEWVRIIIIDDAAAGRAAAPQSADAGGRVIYMAPAAPSASIDRREAIRSQLFAMAPALEAMRAWTGPSDAELATLVAAVEQLSVGSRAMKVTGSASDHALVAAVDGVAAAARARVRALADGTAQSRANAIAAATGALLLLEDTRNVNRKLRF